MGIWFLLCGFTEQLEQQTKRKNKIFFIWKVSSSQYREYMKLPPKDEKICKHNCKEIILGGVE